MIEITVVDMSKCQDMWNSPADTSEDNIEGKKGRQVPESPTSEIFLVNSDLIKNFLYDIF